MIKIAAEKTKLKDIYVPSVDWHHRYSTPIVDKQISRVFNEVSKIAICLKSFIYLQQVPDVF